MDSIVIRNSLEINAQAMTANISSSVIDLGEVRSYNVQFTATGSPVGSYSVMISNDGINFDLLSAAVAITTAGTKNIGDKNIGYRYIKAIYTFTSGSGVLNALVCGKQ